MIGDSYGVVDYLLTINHKWCCVPKGECWCLIMVFAAECVMSDVVLALGLTGCSQ